MKHRILTLLCIALCTQCLSAKEDTYFAIAKNLDLFNSIVKELQLHYVDSIPVDKVVQAGINGMLQKLDPYTNYISAETVKDFKYSTTGEYAGIGATTGDMKHDLKKAQQCGNGRHDHVAPGREVDAATCYLPENTWFIKSHEHMHYESDTAAAFVVWLTLSNTQRNIWQSVLYPQYLQKSKLGDKISALSDPNGVDNNEYMYGDLDIDGRVDAADARLALRYAVGLQGTPTRTMTQIGDVDGNGQIDAADARLILRYSVGLERTFAAAR